MCCLKAGSCFALHPSEEICPEANLISWFQRVTLVTGREKDFVGNSVVRMRAFMRGTAHESPSAGKPRQMMPLERTGAFTRLRRRPVALGGRDGVLALGVE